MNFQKLIYLSTALSVINALPMPAAFAVEKRTESTESITESMTSLTLAPLTQHEIDQHLQALEDQRDLADWRDYTRFKELTTEICTLVGQPFQGDALETDVLPQGEVLHRWIDSIIRTRHKFCGQSCLGKHGMVNRYTVNYPESLMYNYEHHIATIMMIDAMSKLAIADDVFYDAWAEVTEDTPISEHFIKRVLNTMEEDAFGETKPGMRRVKAVARTILLKNSALVRLAGDIFSLYAPKMDLNKVYNDLMVSGGTYRGWEISGLDNFAHVINLTEEEKELYPEFEAKLRNESNRANSIAIDDFYSTCIKAKITSDNIANIHYYFDACLDRWSNVVGKGGVSFNLTRNIKPTLKHLIEKQKSLLSTGLLRMLYESSFRNESIEAYNFWCARGMQNQMYRYAVELYKSNSNRTLALDLFREIADLGGEQALKSLPSFLNNYAASLINGQDIEAVDISLVINVTREAFVYGHEEAKENLAAILDKYASDIMVKENKQENDYVIAIKAFDESWGLGLESSKVKLASTFFDYASYLRHVIKDHKNIFRVHQLLRMASILDHEDANKTLPGVLNNDGAFFIKEKYEIERLKRAVF